MQRLRVASERKYHRWFFETRAELEAGGEAKATLEMELRRMSERAAGLEASVATLTSAKARLEEVVAERGEAGAVLTRRVDGLKVLLREERGRVVGLPRDGEGGMRGDRREVLERALRTALEHEGAERAILEAGIQREREVARELRTLLAGERQMLVEERRRSEAVQGQLDKERERRARAVRHLMGNGSGVSES
ncbi:hypothetical protein B0H67DRAFT_594480 [Lasiosphaeris hirsuta]|uniref:Uncharacterized protein n=1 Tax=Lasiosphaeris hirsuta TaxID=260670 RepID=A0AA40DMT1_9PEZI|nr:hypothetical protein B0H67DRAFT_594480 [Lasiosphaeris hirsuta]